MYVNPVSRGMEKVVGHVPGNVADRQLTGRIRCHTGFGQSTGGSAGPVCGRVCACGRVNIDLFVFQLHIVARGRMIARATYVVSFWTLPILICFSLC